MSNKSAAFLPVGIGAGVAIGTALGLAMDNLALGLSLGVAIGSGLDVALMGAGNLKAQKDKKAADGSPMMSDGGVSTSADSHCAPSADCGGADGGGGGGD
jgi:hypothetical protein